MINVSVFPMSYSLHTDSPESSRGTRLAHPPSSPLHLSFSVRPFTKATGCTCVALTGPSSAYCSRRRLCRNILTNDSRMAPSVQNPERALSQRFIFLTSLTTSSISSPWLLLVVAAQEIRWIAGSVPGCPPPSPCCSLKPEEYLSNLPAQ